VLVVFEFATLFCVWGGVIHQVVSCSAQAQCNDSTLQLHVEPRGGRRAACPLPSAPHGCTLSLSLAAAPPSLEQLVGACAHGCEGVGDGAVVGQAQKSVGNADRRLGAQANFETLNAGR